MEHTALDPTTILVSKQCSILPSFLASIVLLLHSCLALHGALKSNPAATRRERAHTRDRSPLQGTRGESLINGICVGFFLIFLDTQQDRWTNYGKP